MPLNLNAPLAWTKADADEIRLLQNLQGNILKGHGRRFTANIFFRLDPKKPLESKRALREIANYHVTNAHRQLLDTQRHHAGDDSGGPFCHLALAFKAYAALGIDDSKAPKDPHFRAGMAAGDFDDPPKAAWEAVFQQEIHGLLLAADTSEAGTTGLAATLPALLESAGASVVHVQRGRALLNAAGFGIEHFGYVDGRSQPLMLVEDIDKEAADAGVARWDPAFPLSTALIKDPGSDDPEAFGSLFIFRKLEQDVRAFKRNEQVVADQLNLVGADARELAGAMLVGRFEDGTPVTLSDEARGLTPPNDFNYDGDAGARCPFHGHVRKTNPRGSSGIGVAQERGVIMARRGIPFVDVERDVHPDCLPEAQTLAEFDTKVAPLLPTGGVGLLFMAYNHDIAGQFKVTQRFWANQTNFPPKPLGPHGIDPVIGQGNNAAGDQKLPKVWDDLGQGVDNGCPFSGHVTMRGGEFFFSPSLAFLKAL